MASRPACCFSRSAPGKQASKVVNRAASIMRPIRPAALGTRVEASISNLPTSRHTIPLVPREESRQKGSEWCGLARSRKPTPLQGRALGPRCLTGIFACFQTHYQLDGVMVRVSRDAHLVDHALDQEHSPSPRRLRILQLSLQVRSLLSQARMRTATPVDNTHQQALLSQPYLDPDGDFGIVPVAVFHGIHCRLGHGCLEPI